MNERIQTIYQVTPARRLQAARYEQKLINMRRIFQLLICIVLVSCQGNSAQNDHNNINPDQDITKKTNQFFELYAKDPDSAIDFCFTTNKWIPRDSLADLKSKLNSLVKQLGGYYSYEFITTKKLTNSYVLIRFLVKYERQPLRFSFIYYKADKDWQLQNFNYDLNYDSELEDAGKVMLLKENY